MILLQTRDDALAANPNHLLHSYPSRDDATFLPKAHEHTAELSDDAIWIPPEAADDMEDDILLTDDDDNEDDDDESDDDDDGGVSWWQQPAGSFVGSNAAYYREERQKAMLRAMNGQLKMLAARFLESAGIPADTCWLDIVTSLSWEAALLIRPDATAGNEMDPSSYVKVKCLASGTRRQCEVIRGLVFKKNAAHKHMPTRCHNPRLLLLRGVLGDSDTGFSSFSYIEQEKNHL
ncbi:unnamed protein product [Urochloa humidicola]